MVSRVILGILMTNKCTSYDIKKKLDHSVNMFYSTSYGSLQPALKKLHKNGMVIFTEIVENGRLKKIYEITDKGRLHFNDWISKDIELDKIKDITLLRIFFLDSLDSLLAIKLLKNYVVTLEEEIESLQEHEKHIDEHMDKNCLNKNDWFFQLKTLVYGIDYYKFAKNWFTDLIKELEEK